MRCGEGQRKNNNEVTLNAVTNLLKDRRPLRSSFSIDILFCLGWKTTLDGVGEFIGLGQRALSLAAPVTAWAVGASPVSALLASLVVEWTAWRVGVLFDLSVARMVMAVGGMSLCLIIGPTPAALYYALGWLATQPVVPQEAKTARHLLQWDEIAQRRIITSATI